MIVNKEKLQVLDNYLQTCVEENVFPGCDFGLILPDEKYFLYHGYKQLYPQKITNDHDTIWDLASISKVLVTTTCILKLMEEGLITLKTPIADIVKEFENKTITIKDCITHSSGLEPDIAGYKNMTQEQMYDYVYHASCTFETGTKVTYSDINFILLGLVVKNLKGSLDGYAKEIMFEPLEMHDTCYNPDESVYERLAAYEDQASRNGVVRGKVHDGKAYKFGGVSGHAGVFSTLEDISHFVQMILNDGYYNGKKYFSDATIDLLKKCQTPGLNESRSIAWVLSDPNYALGDYYSEHTLYHTGFSGPSIQIDLDRKVAFVCLNNRFHPTRDNKLILTRRNNIHNLAYQCLEKGGK